MRNRILGFAAVAVMLLPAICSAQQATQWRDSTKRLDVAARALRDSLLQIDSTAPEVARRGDLAIAASADQQQNAIDALDQFAKVRDRWFAGAMPAPGGFRILISTGNDGRVPQGASTSNGALILSGLPDSGSAIRVRGNTWQTTAPKAMLDRYGSMMISSVPALLEWIENPPPLSIDENDRRDQAMYAFVTATGPVERRCVEGGLKACEVAMNIIGTGDVSQGKWSPFMRADLMYFALDLGGSGAWNRLRSGADSGVAAALAAAARQPVDSVLAHWRSDLLSRRPVAAVITPGSALLAATWTVALLLAALGASKWV